MTDLITEKLSGSNKTSSLKEVPVCRNKQIWDLLLSSERISAVHHIEHFYCKIQSVRIRQFLSKKKSLNQSNHQSNTNNLNGNKITTWTISALPAPHEANTAHFVLLTTGRVIVTLHGGGLGLSEIGAIILSFSLNIKTLQKLDIILTEIKLINI